jgi:hypothetical protein
VDSGKKDEAVPFLEDLLNDNVYKRKASFILDRINSKK